MSQPMPYRPRRARVSVATLVRRSLAIALVGLCAWAGANNAHAQTPPGGASAPALSVSTRSEGGALHVQINNLVTFCSPAPHWTVTREGTTVHVRLDRPTDVSRCVSPHNSAVDVPALPAGDYTVVIENERGPMARVTAHHTAR